MELLLACARTHLSAEETGAIRGRLGQEIDWTVFAGKAVDHGLVGLAGHTLSQAAPDLVPDEIREALGAIVEETRKTNQDLFDELARLLAALAAVGIDAIPFKGPVLALRAFGDLGLRGSGHLDFLIRDKDLLPAIATLRGLGYERPQQLSGAQLALIHRLQGGEIVLKQSSGLAVGPCTRFTPVTMALDIDYDGLWERAQRGILHTRAILALAPEDDLIILAIEGGRELWWNIKWAADAAALIRARPGLDWTEVEKRARAQGCLRMVLLAASLARRYFGAAIPQPLVALELADPVIESMVARIVTRWQDGATRPPGDRHLSRLRRTLHDGVMRRASCTARNLLVPSPEFVASAPVTRTLKFAYAATKLARNLRALLWRRNSIPPGHTPLRNLSGLFATPELFPMEIDEERNAIAFLRVSREWYRSNVTTNGRADVGAGAEVFSAQVNRLILDLPTTEAGPPAHYILHGAFCGSTLLAGYLEQLPRCFVLKEPNLLGQLARLKVNPPDSMLYAPQQWNDWFKIATALLARAYPSDTAVIIKPTDLCSWMGDLLLNRDARSKIIFLASPLREFLTSVLRPDRDRRILIRNRVRRAKKHLAQVPFLSDATVAALSDGQCAAAIWLLNAYFCASLLEGRDADRVLVLNSKDLFSQPKETLSEVATFLSLTQDEDIRAALMNFTVSARHSKAKEESVPYSAALRTSELAEAERQIQDEIETAVSWAKQVSSSWLSRSPFPVG
ncbi:MAG TPA: nucleotidyltransferase family protein [Rhizomicrobium sp.]|nr:nucleotidyltransferase family protein [Rhizomicrobium sp.]